MFVSSFQIDYGTRRKADYNAPVTVTPQPNRADVGPADATLVAAALANEPWAKEALFRRYVTLVNGLAFRVMGRDADLDDLVQDSFTEAWRCLPRLENPQAFSSWISAIVVRTAHKLLRRRKLANMLGLRRPDSIDFDALLSNSVPPDIEVELRAVYRTVAELPPTTRIAFVLRRVEGLKLEEIASMLELSLATVKRRIVEAERLLAFAFPVVADEQRSKPEGTALSRSMRRRGHD
jgi:RNA polymerase sigma-70 factor, ECF subfamily